MRKKSIAMCVGILAALAIAGCGVSDKDVIGKWTGKVDSAGAGGGMAEAFADMFSVKLELKKDHTFTMTMAFFPIEGSWKRKGNEVFLTPESMFGMSTDDLAKMGGQGSSSGADEPMVLRVSRDRKTMTDQDSGSGSSGQLIYTRDN